VVRVTSGSASAIFVSAANLPSFILRFIILSTRIVTIL
jgi:hypothetical protein